MLYEVTIKRQDYFQQLVFLVEIADFLLIKIAL